jgi:hypothetical protein
MILESSGSMITSVYTLVFSTCCAQFNILADIVMNTSSVQHSIVFYFRFPQGQAVVGKDEQFPFALYDL